MWTEGLDQARGPWAEGQAVWKVSQCSKISPVKQETGHSAFWKKRQLIIQPLKKRSTDHLAFKKGFQTDHPAFEKKGKANHPAFEKRAKKVNRPPSLWKKKVFRPPSLWKKKGKANHPAFENKVSRPPSLWKKVFRFFGLPSQYGKLRLLAKTKSEQKKSSSCS